MVNSTRPYMANARMGNVRQFSVPAAPADLDPEWLTKVLREAGTLPRSAVTHLSTKIIGQERGFTGIVARVNLEYAHPEPDAPASIVAKFPNAAGDSLSTYREAQKRDPAATRRYYERCAREVWFYQQLEPLGGSPAPRMYYGGADLDRGRFVLLLEDLSSMRMGDALLGCSSADAGAVLGAIAPFHAYWWNNRQLDTFTWLPGWAGDLDARQARYSQQVKHFLERHGDKLPVQIRELAFALSPVYREIVAELASGLHTLIHADLHLDNVAFSQADHAKVIDWQGIARGPAAYDLAVFLSGALDTDTRRAAERELLHGYHEMLLQRGVADYSRDQLRRDYRLALLCIFAGNVNWLGSVDLDTLAGRELALVNAVIDNGRLFSALLDNGVGELLA